MKRSTRLDCSACQRQLQRKLLRVPLRASTIGYEWAPPSAPPAHRPNPLTRRQRAAPGAVADEHPTGRRFAQRDHPTLAAQSASSGSSTYAAYLSRRQQWAGWAEAGPREAVPIHTDKPSARGMPDFAPRTPVMDRRPPFNSSLPSLMRPAAPDKLFVPKLYGAGSNSMDGRLGNGQRKGVIQAVAKRNESHVFGWSGGKPKTSGRDDRAWVRQTHRCGTAPPFWRQFSAFM